MKTININKTVQRIYDKKKKSSYLHIGPPKTKTSARTIFVTENLRKWLDVKFRYLNRSYCKSMANFMKFNFFQSIPFQKAWEKLSVSAWFTWFGFPSQKIMVRILCIKLFVIGKFSVFSCLFVSQFLLNVAKIENKTVTIIRKRVILTYNQKTHISQRRWHSKTVNWFWVALRYTGRCNMIPDTAKNLSCRIRCLWTYCSIKISV